MKRFLREVELFCLDIAINTHIQIGLILLQVGLFVITIFYPSRMLASCGDFIFLLLTLVRGVVLHTGSSRRDFVYWFCWNAIALDWVWRIFAVPPAAMFWLSDGCAWYILFFAYNNDDDDSSGGIKKRRDRLKEKLDDRRQTVPQAY